MKADVHNTQENDGTTTEVSEVGAFQVAPEGHFIRADGAMARILGYDSPEELISRITDIARQFYWNPRERYRLLGRLLEDGGFRNNRAPVRRKDGKVIWVSESARVVRDREGGILYFEGTLQNISRHVHAARKTHRRVPAAPTLRSAEQIRLLSKRESDVYTLLVKGKTNKMVAVDLGISERTVEFHRANLKRKLDVTSLAELIAFDAGAVTAA
ncbi:MAG: PAS domain S-box protein [Candidatus Glassbacteria bacterium]|nr:PAS domain S-box protein [Candidatus Glassbacteria bacterium]